MSQLTHYHQHHQSQLEPQAVSKGKDKNAANKKQKLISAIELTRMPSSSFTLLIILTHISGILRKSGCSIQMSRKIFMTRFLTLIPVSCQNMTAY